MLCAPWATFDDLTPAQQAEATEAEWDAWLLAASEILYALSGRRYRGAAVDGGCEVEFTYDADRSESCVWWTRDRPCWHGSSARMRLPDRPTAVTEVLVDGEVLDPGSWYVDGQWLWRVGGWGWPPHGGRVIVTYTHGIAPPPSGKAAVVGFADQFRMADQGLEGCQLPDRVTSVTRQGVTFGVLDPMTYLSDGRTGVYAVDLFLAAENPGGRAKLMSSVWSPELSPAGHRRAL